MSQSQFPGKREYPPYAGLYISYTNERFITSALKDSWEEWQTLFNTLPESSGDLTYAPDKWTVRQLMQHVIDTERVFSYRALRFARGDFQELPGFDEVAYARVATARLRSLSDLLVEMGSVRRATICLFESFDHDALLHIGSANGHNFSVRALGLIIAGHMRHHLHIVKSRYLPNL